MRKVVLIFLIIVLLVFPFTLEQQGQQENNQNQNQDPNNSQNNQNEGQNPGENNQNQNESQNQNENQKPNDEQDSSVNCNENKNNPKCLKEESTKLYEEMKSEVPGFIQDMKNNSEIFSQLDSQQKMDKLQQEKTEFGNLKENLQISPTQENRKQAMKKATKIAEYLTKKDCSNFTNSSSDITKDDSFNNCREEKKTILTDVIFH